MKEPQGLTNKIIFENNLITKISRSEIDYYLDRENEARLYAYFQTLPTDIDFIIRPTKWGYNDQHHFYSQFTYLPNTYTFLEQPNYDVENLTLIKNLIDQYHQLTPSKMVQFEPKIYLNKFRKAIKKPFFDLSEFEEKLNEIINHYYDDQKVCFSHNDLTAGNFLYLNEKEIKLIDYEYSMLNHYLFDYGSFITESLNNNGSEVEFIKLLNLTENETKKLNEIMFYQLILWINWCNYMDEVYHLPIYQTIATQKYETLKNWQF